jgi:hypothetical protein
MPLELRGADGLGGAGTTTHVVAGFSGVEPQPVPEWCWAAVCRAVLRWRGRGQSLCQIVRKVRGLACASGGRACQAAACRQPERLRRALEVLEIPFHEPSPGLSAWAFCLEAIRRDRLVVCQLGAGGVSHAVVLGSVTGPAGDGAPASIGVSDPHPLPEARRSRLYETGFSPRFVAAVPC